MEVADAQEKSKLQRKIDIRLEYLKILAEILNNKLN